MRMAYKLKMQEQFDAWLGECCVVGGHGMATASDLLASLETWLPEWRPGCWTSRGYWTKRALSDALQDRGAVPARRLVGPQGERRLSRVYLGIGLRRSVQPEAPAHVPAPPPMPPEPPKPPVP